MGTFFRHEFQYTAVGQLALHAVLQAEDHGVFVAAARNQLVEVVEGRTR